MDPWPEIAARLDPLLGTLPSPVDYHRGRTGGRPGSPDNILLFLRRMFGEASHATHHHRHVLILALAGEGGVCVDRHVHLLRPGMAVLIHPHQLHHYVDVRGPLLWLFVTFEQDALAWRALFNRMSALRTDHEALLTRLVELFRDPRPEAGERLGLVAGLLLAELAERALPPPDDSAPAPADARLDLLGRINRIVYDRLDRPPGIAALAAQLGISASHLRWLVRRSLGIGLGQYLLRVRLNHARTLLRDPRLRVGEVGRRCGFASPQAFSRAYQRMHGCAPRAERSRNAGP